MKTKFKSAMIIMVVMAAFMTFNSCKKDVTPTPTPEPQQVAVGGMCLYGHFDGNDCVLPTTNCLCEIVVLMPHGTQMNALRSAAIGGDTSIPKVRAFFESGAYKAVFPKLDSSDGGKILLNKFKNGFYAMSIKGNSAGTIVADSFYVAGTPAQLQNNEAEWVFPVKIP